jgi:sialate O-acetylesterase
MCTVKRQAVNTAAESCKGKWVEHTPESVAECSATAYFFAKRLQETLEIPIGIIISAWGGSIIESWMPRNLMEKYSDEVDLTVLDKAEMPETPNKCPCYLYNGMLHPVRNYDIKGVIWYQGCTNRGKHERYAKIQPEFVSMLRDLFETPELPFYYVQIAPFKYDGADRIGAALLREAQADGLKTIQNCGMVVSMDCGDEFCIHPAKKKPIGDRLAYLALENSYGFKGLESAAPTYQSMEIIDGKAYVKFNVGIKGIGPKGHQLDGFEIAGEDRVFHKADAQTGKGGDIIVVSSPEVSNPVAVRYAFRNCSPVSVYNTYGIPASPFRTDNW